MVNEPGTLVFATKTMNFATLTAVTGAETPDNATYI
jgi:hypothetical protein